MPGADGSNEHDMLRSTRVKEDDMLNPGDLAPDFVSIAHTGETIRLKDLRGSRVLIWFYPAADTPG